MFEKGGQGFLARGSDGSGDHIARMGLSIDDVSGDRPDLSKGRQDRARTDPPQDERNRDREARFGKEKGPP